MPVGLVDRDAGSAQAFPAEELGLTVRWHATAASIDQMARKDGVEKVVLRYEFDDAGAAARAAHSIEDAHAGATYLALSSGELVVLVEVISVVGRMPGRRDQAGRLTARETQVLRMIRSGCTNREIARGLVISLSTVNRHVEHILLKLHARNRAHAASLLGEPANVRA